jgi:hypothetical protein
MSCHGACERSGATRGPAPLALPDHPLLILRDNSKYARCQVILNECAANYRMADADGAIVDLRFQLERTHERGLSENAPLIVKELPPASITMLRSSPGPSAPLNKPSQWRTASERSWHNPEPCTRSNQRNSLERTPRRIPAAGSCRRRPAVKSSAHACTSARCAANRPVRHWRRTFGCIPHQALERSCDVSSVRGNP